jgi:AcrR family transcriptional regulator
MDAMRSIMRDPDTEMPTVAAVAAAAGVARSAFYSHFEGVEDLAMLVLEADLRELAIQDESMRGDSESAAEATRAVLARMVRALVNHQPIYAWIFLRGGQRPTQHLRDALAENTRRNMTQTGLDAGLSRAQLEVTVAYAAGGFVNTMTKYFEGAIDLPLDELVDVIVQLSPSPYRREA